MQRAIFYHAGCPICVEAESKLTQALDTKRYDIEIVHLGNAKDRIPEAKSNGIQSVPALLLEGTPLHINFGASLDDLT